MLENVNLSNLSIGGGIGLCGIGFIIQQVRFWVKGPNKTRNNNHNGIVNVQITDIKDDIRNIKNNIRDIFHKIDPICKDVSWLKGKLDKTII